MLALRPFSDAPPPPMTRPLRVCLLGFSEFESNALGASLRLTVPRQPAYEPVLMLEEADLVVVDADQTDSLATMVRIGRLEQAVFVGTEAPAQADGWLARPVDSARLLRELDRLAFALGLADPQACEPVTSSPGALSGPGKLRPSRRREADTPPPGWARALLVDDSEIALRFLETRLQREGLFTERALHSGQALEMIARKAYDFVFLDVELGPGSDLDGLGLCQQIKRNPVSSARGHVPVVVMVSAHHAELDRARGALAGCDAYLNKPLDMDQLHRVLQQHRH